MNESPEHDFTLNPHLAADTAFIADWELSRLLLMDDVRFPWLILVPRREGLIELDDLREDDQHTLLREISRAMQLLRDIAPCDKLNIGMLGNIVQQLHVHIVARRSDDTAWPGPAWGCGTAQPYDAAARDMLTGRLRNPPEIDVQSRYLPPLA